MSRQQRNEMRADPAAALRLCEQRLQSILELSTEWYWEQDEHYRFTLFLRARKDDAGDDLGAVVGTMRWDHGAVPVGAGESWDPHKACLDAREAFRDFVFQRADQRGELHYISTSGQPVFDGERFVGYRGIARDVTAGMRAEQMLRLEHMVARCVASADSARAALEEIIRSICDTQGWECGRYFGWNEKAGVLEFREFWHVPNPQLDRFIEKSRNVTYSPGAGLVGDVFKSGRPLWVTDIVKDKRLLKGVARDAGMRGTCLFPVVLEGHPVGVLSFHSRKVRDPDDRLLQTMGAIGSQIGQFLHRKQAEVRVQYLATHDGLTALPNRMLFGQLLKGAIRSARRYSSSFAVLFVDLDGFKQINDTLGHEAGDQLLKEMATRFSACVRASDVVARVGGDEFVVLVQEAGEAEQVAAVARKILAAASQPVDLMGKTCRVTASVGICMFPTDAKDAQSLMKYADIAMYLAKGEGKNNFQFYGARNSDARGPAGADRRR